MLPDAGRQPSSSASPPLAGRGQQQRPKPGGIGSHSAGVTPARQRRQVSHLQIIRANLRPMDPPDQEHLLFPDVDSTAACIDAVVQNL